MVQHIDVLVQDLSNVTIPVQLLLNKKVSNEAKFVYSVIVMMKEKYYDNGLINYNDLLDMCVLKFGMYKNTVKTAVKSLQEIGYISGV